MAGRPKLDTGQIDNWLHTFLFRPVLRSKVYEKGEEAGFSKNAINEARVRLQIGTLSVPGESEDFFILFSALQVNDGEIEDDGWRATEENLMQIARSHSLDDDSATTDTPQRVLEILKKNASGFPANPPVSSDRVREIWEKFFPEGWWESKRQKLGQRAVEREHQRLMSERWSVEQKTVDHVLALPTEEAFQQWVKQYRASRRRPLSVKELDERRAKAMSEIKNEIANLRSKIEGLSARKVELTLDEIDLLPEVAAFIARFANTGNTYADKVPARKEPELKRLRDKYRSVRRALTPEEIAAETAVLEAAIVQKQLEAEQALAHLSTGSFTVSMMTFMDMCFLSRLREVWYAAQKKKPSIGPDEAF